VGSVLQGAIAALPPPLRAALGDRLFAGFSARGLIAFGWNHPITQAIGGAPAVILGSRAIAGEVGAGRMELLLATPFARRRYFMTEAVFAAAVLLALACAGIAGTALGLRLFGLDPAPRAALASLGASFFLLQLAWYAIAIAASAWSGDGGRVAGIVFLAAVISYLIDIVGQLFAPAARLLPVSLYHYYAPQAILVDGASRPASFVVPGAVAIAGLCAAAWRFERRDIP